jgi:Protein of unknown function (DUF2637)
MTEQPHAGLPRAMRVIAIGAVCAGVAALAAGAFVLSYAGLHSVALQAGVSHRLARGYPLMFDVLLVVILAALLALRGAGWPSRILAWVCLLALLGAAAGADALHAAGHRLPARPAAVTAAILPWALVLIAFVLLLAMLRQARLRRLAHAGPAGPSLRKLPPPEPPPLSRQGVVPGFPGQQPPAAGPIGPGHGSGQPLASGLSGSGTGPSQALASGPNDTLRLAVPRQVAPAVAADAGDMPVWPSPAADETQTQSGTGTQSEASTEQSKASTEQSKASTEQSKASTEQSKASTEQPPTATAADHDLAIDSELAPDDPSSDETALDPAYDPIPYPTDSPAGVGSVMSSLSPAPTVADAPAPAVVAAPAEAADPDMPVFHRMWSSPEPPSDPESAAEDEPAASSEPTAEDEPAASSSLPANSEPTAEDEPAASSSLPANSEPTAEDEPAASSSLPANSEPTAEDEPAASSSLSASSEPTAEDEPAASSEPTAENEPAASSGLSANSEAGR